MGTGAIYIGFAAGSLTTMGGVLFTHSIPLGAAMGIVGTLLLLLAVNLPGIPSQGDG